MDYHFSPSLEHMAAVKIALLLFYDRDIEGMMEEEWFLPQYRCCIIRERIQLWKTIQTMAAEKLHFMPNSLKSKVSNIIRPLLQETERWVWDHKSVLGLPVLFSYATYKGILCWRADGTVDRVETARKIARDRRTGPETRFAVACLYFLEEEVLALWHGDEKINVQRLVRHRTNIAIRFWVTRLSSRSSINVPWRFTVDICLGFPGCERNDIRLRVSSFFPYLSRESRKNYIDIFDDRHVHSDDYRLCMRAMDETERMEHMSVYADSVLFYCLAWPFQSIFIDMVNQSWSYMRTGTFDFLLLIIISSYIFQGWDGLDYVELLKEFWYQSPDTFKLEIRKQTDFYLIIELILNYDAKNAPLSLPETMNQLMRRLLSCDCA